MIELIICFYSKRLEYSCIGFNTVFIRSNSIDNIYQWIGVNWTILKNWIPKTLRLRVIFKNMKLHENFQDRHSRDHARSQKKHVSSRDPVKWRRDQDHRAGIAQICFLFFSTSLVVLQILQKNHEKYMKIIKRLRKIYEIHKMIAKK